MQVIPAVIVSLAWTEETRVHTVKWIVIGSPTDQCYHPQVTGHTVRSTAPLHRGASGVVVVVVGVMVDLKVMMVQGWARALTTTSIY